MAAPQSPQSSGIPQPSKTEFLTCRSSTRYHSENAYNFTLCPELRKRCEKETGQDWNKIAHITTLIFDESLWSTKDFEGFEYLPNGSEHLVARPIKNDCNDDACCILKLAKV
ncbi:hypothetical protein CFP56_018961 [Quercus suber]|uniref:Uncharacterized protein n=1 Tax=Quercus suber TaxID=58331 RepID=A0AAW0KJS3_QUESU